MNPLLDQFLIEARENLKFIEQNLENLPNGDVELLNSIFRAAHTLKGGAGLVGFDSVKEITHVAEDLLDLLRSKKIEFHVDMIDALYDSFDEVVNLVEAAEETQDVVEGDAETIKNIKQKLSVFKNGGQEEKVKEWCEPFKYFDDPQKIIDKDFSFLKDFNEKIPYKYKQTTENNLNDKRLYAIVLDPDEECMVFGNDPVYTFSLLEKDLLDLRFCMSQDMTAYALSDEDEDGLILKSQIVGFAYTTWENIEEALYNFLDDLYLVPLDLCTLLSVTSHKSQKVTVLKDVKKDGLTAINENNIQKVISAATQSLDVLNQETFEYKILKRLSMVADNFATQEYSYIKDIFQNLFDSEVEEVKEKPKEVISPKIVKVEEKSEKQESTKNLNVEIDETTLDEIYSQQIEQLENSTATDVVERVHSVLSSCSRFFNIEEPSCDENSLKAWLSKNSTQKVVKIEAKKDEKVAIKDSKDVKEVEVKPAEVKKEIKKEVPKDELDKKKDVIGKIVKVEQESIDTLMSLVGELLVAKNSLPYLAEMVFELDKESTKRSILEKYSFINRLTNQLQDLIMSMRMLPMSYVFDRYPKLVRDMSRNLGKKVRLIQEGNETKLDKNMIEMLADPLVHIVRNSLDHGIELSDVRSKNGKDEQGTVIMRAYPQSDKVLIEIEDDGKGIDGEAIARKVLEKGLIPVEKIEEMTPQEKAELVMLPGLSTAESISEYSGRGVGMDVVKKSVESFGGVVSIETVLGKGTKIILAVPVSLAVTTLLHVMMDDCHYGIPMDSVSETVKLEQEEVTYLHNKPFVHIREQIIPLIFHKSMLNHEALKNKTLSIAVLNIKGNPVALVVNELLGQLDVVQKPLEGVLAKHPILGGTALLGNGQIIMVIDPIGLLRNEDYKNI